jgi:Ni/Fe-hydrogenase 1 B-type cytochrome subunit
VCAINDAPIANLASVNIWLDVIFSTLLVVLLLGFVAHYIGSILSGRWKKKWLAGEWPVHEEPHPPALPKFIHFVHMVMMIVLAFTGMYIRFPFFYGGRTTMRYIHYIAMVVVGVSFLWRIWYAFYSKARDYKEFAVGKKDLGSMLGVLMYYTYMSNSKPHVAKYNVMQKLAYDAFLVLMVFQGLTGICLLTMPLPLLGVSPRYLMTFWWADLVGGIAMAGAWMRVAHYTINWLFIIITLVHVYLACTEDVPVALDFFGVEYKGKIADGHGAPHGLEGGHGTEEPALEPAGDTAGETPALSGSSG